MSSPDNSKSGDVHGDPSPLNPRQLCVAVDANHQMQDQDVDTSQDLSTTHNDASARSVRRKQANLTMAMNSAATADDDLVGDTESVTSAGEALELDGSAAEAAIDRLKVMVKREDDPI